MADHEHPRLFIRMKRIAVICLFILASLALAGCPPQPLCDEKIKDPAIFEQIVLSDPVIQQLDHELKRMQLTISDCIVNNQVGVILQYEMPSEYSEFGVIYRDQLFLVYSLEGNLGLPAQQDQAATFQSGAITGYFSARIQELETNPRVREVLSKTGTDPLNPSVPLFGEYQVMRSGDNRVEYSYFYHLVRGYILSNDTDWREFPEIAQAHRIVVDNILVGALSSCSIGHGKMHAYTVTRFHDTQTGPWYLTVAVQCPDGWKDANVQINADGSFERLEIGGSY